MFRVTFLLFMTLGFVVMSRASSWSEPSNTSMSGKRLDLEELSWMKGAWTRQEGERRMEEYWTNPAGGTMMGVARTIVGTRTVEYEFLRIVQTKPNKIVYLASPGGRCPPTSFALKLIDGERVVFENLDHDFPQRIIYWRDADGTLHARIEGEVNGQPKQIEWSWLPQRSEQPVQNR